MATNVSQIISTLGEGLSSMAPYAGGSIPPASDVEYANWISWWNQGQEDAAQRGFWSRLLTKTTLSIANGDTSTNLPTNFHKRNGIFLFDIGGVDWADPFNSDGQKLFVHRNPTTAVWEVLYNGFVPKKAYTVTLWYFFLPPKLVSESDPLFLDGKMILFYALTEYYRQSGELGSLDDSRGEYNNRFLETLNLDQLPSRNELMSFTDVYGNQGVNRNERSFYGSRRFRR